jgi:hypothetical protein
MGQLKFDFAREVDETILAEGQRGSRPLTTIERNKSAAEPGLAEGAKRGLHRRSSDSSIDNSQISPRPCRSENATGA